MGRIVDERFSVNVGAVRFTEQFGLAKAVSADVVAEALAAIAAELGPPRRATTTGRGRGDGRRRDEPGRGEARPGHLRPGRRPGDGPGPGRDRSPDRAVPDPGRRLGDGRSSGCSRRVPRSSSPARASSARSSTSSAATRSRSATAGCATACSSSASARAARRADRAGCAHDGRAEGHPKRYLQRARDALLWKLDGLSERDLRMPADTDRDNLAGIVKHCANVEVGTRPHLRSRLARSRRPLLVAAGVTTTTLRPTGTSSRRLGVRRSRLHRRGGHRGPAIDELSLDTVGSPPWWPGGSEVTLHHMLVRVVDDLARHAGQADIVLSPRRAPG